MREPLARHETMTGCDWLVVTLFIVFIFPGGPFWLLALALYFIFG